MEFPSHRAHKKVSKAIFGSDYSYLHHWIDEPVKQFGPRHREYRHGPSDILRTLLRDGFEPALVHTGHIIQDLVCTEANELFRSLGVKTKKKKKR